MKYILFYHKNAQYATKNIRETILHSFPVYFSLQTAYKLPPRPSQASMP